jgi:hypothetical protein
MTFTTTRQIATGEHVVVVVGGSGSAVCTAITVGSLTLTQDKTDSGTYTMLQVWSARATSSIASGSTVTLTSNGTYRDAACFSLSGVASSSYVDVTANAGVASTTTPSVGPTAATALSGSIAVAAFRGSLANTGLISPGAGYTEITEVNNAAAGWSQQAEYQTLASTGTQTATWSLSQGTVGEAVIVVYKPA